MAAGIKDLSGPIDLDSTAELPVLAELARDVEPAADPLARTDSWPQPPAFRPPAGAHSTAEAPGDASRELLTLQQRLAEREERLAALERQLAAEQAAHRLATGNVAALQVELTGARTAVALYQTRMREAGQPVTRGRESPAPAPAQRLQRDLEAAQARGAAALEALQSLEARRSIFDSQLRDLLDQVQAREQEAVRGRSLQQQLAERDRRITELERELAGLSASLASTADAAGDTARDNAQLRESVRRYEEQIAAQAAQIERLQSEAAALQQAHEQLRREHAVVSGELGQLRLDSEGHAAAVRQVTTEHAQRLEQIAAAEARVRELQQANAQLEARLAEAQAWLEARVPPVPQPPAAGTPDAGVPQLVRTVHGQELVHVLRERTTIGRTADNDLQINADYVSRQHAVITLDGGEALIEDRNSTNGVLVNGRRVRRQVLRDGDGVVIGKLPFRFVVRPAGPPSGGDR